MNFSVFFWIVLLVVFIYLIYYQITQSEKEDFEDREN
jgi:uncharacterized membrane protein